MTRARRGEIGRAFARARAEGRAALVPYLTAGFPDREGSLRLLVAVADAGADVIELGVPFSDPVADGPVIQRASERARAGGMTLAGAIALAAAFRRERSTPLLLFTYLNPILRRGVPATAHDLARAGGDGALVCDLPADEDPGVAAAFRAEGLDWVSLVAPTSAEERLDALTGASSGFVYLIARTGVTGAGEGDVRLARQIAALRRRTPLPIALGFGIADAAGARLAASLADGIVVGSALLERVAARGPEAGVELVRELRDALDTAGADVRRG